MADDHDRRSLARIDHATLLAAARSTGTAQREACRAILAQVYRVVAAVLGPRSADVADVAQDAFLRVHRGISGFSYDEARPHGPTAWVNKIALRTALDHRAALPPWDLADTGGLDTEPDGDVRDSVSALDRSVLAAALLHRLDERHRAILILFYWNGETQEEIAATLSIPVGTVKTRMRAAHRRMQEYVLEQAAARDEIPLGDHRELVEA